MWLHTNPALHLHSYFIQEGVKKKKKLAGTNTVRICRTVKYNPQPEISRPHRRMITVSGVSVSKQLQLAFLCNAPLQVSCVLFQRIYNTASHMAPIKKRKCFMFKDSLTAAAHKEIMSGQNLVHTIVVTDLF